MTSRIISLWDIMQQFKGGDLVVLLRAMREAVGDAKNAGWPVHNWNELKQNIRLICSELEALDFPVTLEKTQMALEILENEVGRGVHADLGEIVTLGGLHMQRYQAASSEAVGRFRSEANSRLFFSLTAREKSLFNDGLSKFGDEVRDKFKSSRFDIEEAAKCLALGRYTACVFHVMRAAEAAVAVLAQHLEATVVNAHGETLPWAVLVANIKPKIESMPKGDKQDDWFKIHSLLHSCNRAYRTKTAHPSDKYTEEEAETAFQATQSFLREFAALI